MATNIAKGNMLYFSKMKLKKILKSLIKSGKEILPMYKEYDPRISKFEFLDVDTGFFSNNIEIKADMTPVIFCEQRILNRNKCIKARIYEPRQAGFPYSEYKEVSFYIDGKDADEIRCTILCGLSKQGISVFNLNEYEKWENRCLSKLGAIGYGRNDFSRATGNPNPFVNYDIHFIQKFERQIASLTDILENITDSSGFRKFIKEKWVKILKFIFENPLKFSLGILSAVISGFVISWFSDPLKNVLILSWHKMF